MSHLSIESEVRRAAFAGASAFSHLKGGGGASAPLPDGRSGGLRGRAFARASGLLLFLSLWVGAAPASAAVLVSNLGQSNGNEFYLGTNDMAQAFRTGANAQGYRLTGVTLRFKTVVAAATYDVGVWSSDEAVGATEVGSGSRDGVHEPHTKLGSLSCPALTTSTVDYSCTTTGINLDAGTTYLLMIDGSAATQNLLWNTRSPAEDAGGASGWTIDQLVSRARATAGKANENWNTAFNYFLKIRIDGDVKGSSSNANNAPTVATQIPDRTATVGGAFSYVIPEAAFTDADEDTLTYTAVKSDDTALPSWLSFTAATRTFSGTPQASDAGTVSVKVTASDGNGGSVSDIFDITVSAAPAAPTGFQAMAGDGRVTLSWNDPRNSGITGYQIQSRRGSGQWSNWGNIDGSDASTTTHAITGLVNNTGYRYRIRALGAGGAAGARSSTVWVTPVPVISKPVLRAVPGDERVTLSWAARSGVSSWGYEYRRAGGSWSAQTRVGGSATGTVVEGLDNGVAYTFRLFVAAGARQSVWSNFVTVTTVASPRMVVMPRSLTVAEGGSGIYTVKLNTQPTAAVAVAVLGASGDVSASPSGLTFTTGNWSSARTVTVSAAEDSDGIPDPDVSLTHTASGGDYGSVPAITVMVSVTENDPAPGVTASASALTVAEGGSGTYTMVLNTEPTAAVTVAVSGASGDVSASPSSLTFTTGNWSSARTVTVSAAEDADADADAAVTLTHAASGGGYDSVTIGSVAVTVTETTPILQLPSDPEPVTEGESIVLTVASDRDLTGPLTVSLTLSDRGSGGFAAEDLPGGLGPRDFEADFGESGGRTGTVTIPTHPDSEGEGAETYRIALNAGSGYVVGGDAAADGTLRDGGGGAAGRANRVNEAVLPQVAAALLSQSLGVIAGRIETVAAGAPDAGALPALNLGAGESPRLRGLLEGAAFALPLGGNGGGKSPVSVWGRGEWTDLDGSEDGVDWDGDVWSAHVGADLRLRPDLLAGAAVSYSESDLDARVEGVESVYETRLTAVHPYMAWLFEDGSRLWASVGYGEGEVRIREEGGETREADLRMRSVAAGGRRALSEVAGAARLALKGEASLARARTDAEDGLERLSVEASRLRVALEVSRERVLEDGGTLVPSLEAGARYDGGDAADGAGLETGASLSYRNAARGLTAELRVRALVAHEEDRDEWGASGTLSLEPGAHGRGPSLRLGLSRGGTESGVARLFERAPASDAGSGERARHRLEMEVGHGFAAPWRGPVGLISPYAGLTLEEAGERSLRFGARYRLTHALDISLEARRRLDGADGGASEIALRGELRW